MTLWTRVGEPFELTQSLDGGIVHLAWTWRVEREGGHYREVRVIVDTGIAPGLEELPTQALAAVRARGELCIDRILDDEDPPRLIHGPRPESR